MSEEMHFGTSINRKGRQEVLKELKQFYLEKYTDAAKKAAKDAIKKMEKSMEKIDFSEVPETKNQYHTEPYIVNKGGMKITLFELGVDPNGWALAVDEVKDVFYKSAKDQLNSPRCEKINTARTISELNNALYEYNKKELLGRYVNHDSVEPLSLNTVAYFQDGRYNIEQATADEIRFCILTDSAIKNLIDYERRIKNERSKRD